MSIEKDHRFEKTQVSIFFIIFHQFKALKTNSQTEEMDDFKFPTTSHFFMWGYSIPGK